MPAPSNILVAIDFSPHSDIALARATEMAERFDAKLHLLHVFTLQDKTEAQTFQSSDLHALKDGERQKLEASAAPLHASGHLGQVLWHEGDPKSDIVETANRQNVDLIVLGASSVSGLKRLYLDDVAEAVAKDANCSVLVVRERTA